MANTQSLSGKTAVVTGSSTGIGFAIAKGLARSGAKVVLNGRDQHWLDAAVKLLRKDVPGVDAMGIMADLATADGCAAITETVTSCDVLVNNLGVFAPKPFFEIDDDDWQRYFQINVMSGVRLSRHYAKGMVDKRWGRILFNASVTGGFVPGEMVHYGTTKAALLGLSRGLAESVAGSGVTVNAFIPGPTRTERIGSALDADANAAKAAQSVVEESLIQRFTTPDEVAALVTFLASPEASAITGASLRVDGGMVRSIL